MTAPADQVTVECDVAAHALTRNHRTHRAPIPVPTVLRWRADDPWAVEIHFTTDHRSWFIGWELLASGHVCGGHWAGEGDIRIRRHNPAAYHLRFASPDGTALIRVDAWDLATFVAAVAPRQPAAAARATATGHLELRALLDGDPR